MANSRHLSTEELLEKWRINRFDLKEIIREEEMPFKVNIPMKRNGHQLSDSVIRHAITAEELDNIYFAVEDVLEFEKKHPEYAPQETPYISKDGETPPYLSRKHEYFSEELSIAIETWLAMFGPGGKIKTKTSPKKTNYGFSGKLSKAPV